ncbi:MAG: PBP1A family penicillin-binding protein [Acidobacteriia bacterium]|nr:PBP1A family penicillin-binding protein [Terriglobia bacterium]
MRGIDEAPEVLTPTKRPLKRIDFSRWARNGVTVAAALVLTGFAVFGFYYVRFSRLIDRRLAAGPFSNTVDIFSAPRTVAVGDALTLPQVVTRLIRDGYTTSRGNALGWYHLRSNAVEIFPGRDGPPGGEPGVLEFEAGKISRIFSLQDNTERGEYQIPPELMANLSENREKRRLVHFADIPPSLVDAVLSAEDKRFFQHTGFDAFRIMKAAYVDLRDGRKEQGASTLSMQLARGFWLDPDKSWKRKLQELVITVHLEHRLTKQQIFEDYANQVYLGRRGTFSINGFGEGAREFFGKDLSQVTVAEAALLAGLVQRPSFFNPYRYPGRARERRDLVLARMRENRYLNETAYRNALAQPVKLVPEQSESVASQYFVDSMNDELQSRLDDHEEQTRYIYTTLDPNLQEAAEQAVADGMRNVDQQLRKRKKHAPIPHGQPQAALVALDPHTGEIKALVGGRDYDSSQLNHARAMRQPGSVFKPIVYAAALDTAVEGGSRQIFTPASVLSDEPTSFFFDGRAYQPANFKHEFMGDVTLRTALAHSLNVATVELAQKVGYQNVVEMARRVGLNDGIKATPAVALGAYETTPLEIAGAYTAFANHGMRVKTTAISLVRARDGEVLYEPQPVAYRALDPRVAYLMVSMMQEVLRSGTGARVHSLGFTLPAAGKTGTSRDGWFTGFTSELLCVVWIGFDDNRDLDLEGARSALPVWAEFMKSAARFRRYRDAKPFQPPAGVTSARICPDSGQLATDFCPNARSEVFISGSEPVVECQMHGMATQQAADRIVDLPSGGSPTPSVSAPSNVAPNVPVQTPLQTAGHR